MSRQIPLIYAIRELADALDEKMGPLLAEANLTVSQFSVLHLLAEEGPMRAGQLAEHQRCVKSNISYLIRTMEKEGLLELQEDPNDRRARTLNVSALGWKRYRFARNKAARIERKLIKKLKEGEGDTLERLCLSAANQLDEDL